jgi:threonine dehydrogenase-like Zn-dependent dehydrogenase
MLMCVASMPFPLACANPSESHRVAGLQPGRWPFVPWRPHRPSRYRVPSGATPAAHRGKAHDHRRRAREFGATDIVTERGDEGVARIMDMTNGIGADSVLECVGTQEAMQQTIRCTRKGGYVSYVGVPRGVELNGEGLFFAHVHLHGGPAPVRRYLPKLIDLVWNGKINPGKVFDLQLPMSQVAECYRAMDERRAIKALLWP